MNLLFQRRAGAAASEFGELNRLLSRVNTANAQTRLAVGAGVHLANAEFIRRFGGIESLRRMPGEEQQRFIAALSDLETGSQSEQPGLAVGVGLYRIWLIELLAGRREIAERLGEELTRLSRKVGGA